MEKSTHESYKIELFAPVMKECNGKYIAVLSDTSLDRDGEMISREALENVAKNPGYIAALLDHENKVLAQVASWENIKLVEIDGHYALVGEPAFFESNPNAKIVRGMLNEGAKMGISIGAMVNSYEERIIDEVETRVFTSIELLEASFVAVPSNRHGRAMAVAKSFTKNIGGIKMSEEHKFTQKDLDLSIKTKTEELNKSVVELKKTIESQDSELTEIKKELEEAKESVEETGKEKDAVEAEKADAEEKVASLKTDLEKSKKVALEKTQAVENFEKKDLTDLDTMKKNAQEGKLPIIGQRGE